MNSETLIIDLVNRTKENLNKVQSFVDLNKEVLNYKASPEKWSVLECIEHLNRYGDFYIPEIKQQIQSSNYKHSDHFKTGVLGNYFAKSMLPKEKLNKMKTFKPMNPIGSKLNKEVLSKFITQQQMLLDLLNKARSVNLTKTKTGISISKWIKLRLGDTFRVVIYHNQRHVVQAGNVLERFDELVHS